MIKNYIFDFGNVLSQFYPDKLTAPFVSDKKELKNVSDVVFDRLYWDRLDDGSITDEEVKSCIKSRLPNELGEVGCKVYDNWICSMIPVPNMKELVLDIKRSGKKLYLLSNISNGFANGYKDVPWLKELLECFDGLVFSAEVNLVKPNREIFEYLLEKFSLNADECLFIDDSEKNIIGAKNAGIDGYLFDGNAEKLRKYLGY